MPLYSDLKSPGPGAYLSTDISNKGVEISLAMSRRAEEKDDIPGPGAYNPKKQNVQKRPKSAKIGTSKRFYTIKTQCSPSFYDSRKESKAPQYSFTKKKRLNDKPTTNPGPGAYKIPS